MCKCRKRLFAVMAIFVHASGRASPLGNDYLCLSLQSCASACNPTGNGRRRVWLRSDKKLGWEGICRRITAFYKFRQLIPLATEPHGPRRIQREKEGDIPVTHCAGQHHRIVKTRDLNESESRGKNCDAINTVSILLSRRNRGSCSRNGTCDPANPHQMDALSLVESGTNRKHVVNPLCKQRMIIAKCVTKRIPHMGHKGGLGKGPAILEKITLMQKICCHDRMAPF